MSQSYRDQSHRDYIETVIPPLFAISDKSDAKLEKLMAKRKKHLAKWENDDSKSRADIRRLINLFNKREKEIILRKERKLNAIVKSWHAAQKDFLDTLAESNMQAKYAERGHASLKELKKAYATRMRTEWRNKERRAAVKSANASKKSKGYRAVRQSPKGSKSPKRSPVASAD